MRYRPPCPDAIVLERHAGVLEARGRDDPPGSGVFAEWRAIARTGGRAAPRSRSPLRSAIGDAHSVIDATGGFGIDAWTLACAGCRVTMIERSPVMAALLEDALERARRDDPETAKRVSLQQGDARTVLAAMAGIAGGGGACAEDERPDAIYLDPMFPPKRRASALPSKQMQFLAAVVGADLDATELLATARRVACKRVVVKRPPHADPLAPDAAFTIASKLLRFDVYHPAVRAPLNRPEVAAP